VPNGHWRRTGRGRGPRSNPASDYLIHTVVGPSRYLAPFCHLAARANGSANNGPGCPWT
jgi:hypothetical protein